MDNSYLCRGKRVDNGEWVYGQYLESDNANLILTRSVKSEVLPGEYEILSIAGDFLDVDPSTAGRYSGLSAAKSYRGTEPEDLLIWENDKIKDVFSDEYGIVKYGVYKHQDASNAYQNGDCGFYVDWSHTDKCKNNRLDLYYWAQYGIIGNIHDTPELLEG